MLISVICAAVAQFSGRKARRDAFELDRREAAEKAAEAKAAKVRRQES